MPIKMAFVRRTSALAFIVGAAVVATLFMAVYPAFADQSFEQNTDRPGNDIANFDVTKTGGAFSSSADQVCSERCRTTAGCVAWTFVKGSGGAGRCWLKDRIPPKRANSCCTSGVIALAIEWDVDRPGNDYTTVDFTGRLDAAPHHMCRETCEEDGRCQAWTYVKQTHVC